jgi:hypothetical protein
MRTRRTLQAAALCQLALAAAAPSSAEVEAPRRLLWGDTHLHTSNSFDAYLNRNTSADPDTAYRYAQGLPVVHPYHRARVRIETPLDFLVVADHAEYLGVIRTIMAEGIPREDLGWLESLRARVVQYWLEGVIEDDEGMEAFTSFLPMPGPAEEAAKTPPVQAIPAAAEMSRSAWQEAIRAAEAHNRPGRFTTLLGWEWSSIPGGANLHRVVFTSAGGEVAARFQPYASTDSMYPEDLWAWLEETSARTGAEFVAIPHNSNISKGYMFAESTLRGAPFTPELARKRRLWEPVVEVTQIKGDSETHPALSPDDPFADFEPYPYYIQQEPTPYEPGIGDYVRPALLRGLSLERRLGENPYRFGLIGSTDSHTGLASAEEPNFWGKLARDSIPENKQAIGRAGGPTGWSMSASGLAAVWAEANTRQAILDAFRRREVYATTGPRIGVRVAGGWDLGPGDAGTGDLDAIAPGRGVPMGADLPPREDGQAPAFLVVAQKDPVGANLDRIQIVKGWLDANGQTHERVFDVAGSGSREPDAEGRLPAVGSTVDPDTARYTDAIGAPTLSALWRDPDFDPAAPAFYYVRVLEIPTPRHSVFDALALGRDPRTLAEPVEIQERAYTSPIWYAP